MNAIETKIVSAIRKSDRSSRLQTICRYSVNTGSRKVRACALCGAWVSSWSAAYPQTKSAAAAEAAHVAAHVAEVNASGLDAVLAAYGVR
jgi:hypothetical protein